MKLLGIPSASQISREKPMSAVSVFPLAISEEYDQLLCEGECQYVWCQDCQQLFVDRKRRTKEGSRILAIFCLHCRARRRFRLAAPLPWARVLTGHGRVAALVRRLKRLGKTLARPEKGT
jgi:RNase P subunit RPR2